MFLSGVLRHDGRPLRPSRREGRLPAGSRHRLVHGRRCASQRGVDAHRLLPLPERYEYPSRTCSGRENALHVPADPARRADVLPGAYGACGTYRAAETQPLLGRDVRASRLRRLVAGTRPAPCLLQRPARGAHRRRDVRCRGLLRGVEPLPGPEQAEPFDAVPSGRGPVGAWGVA